MGFLEKRQHDFSQYPRPGSPSLATSRGAELHTASLQSLRAPSWSHTLRPQTDRSYQQTRSRAMTPTQPDTRSAEPGSLWAHTAASSSAPLLPAPPEEPQPASTACPAASLRAVALGPRHRLQFFGFSRPYPILMPTRAPGPRQEVLLTSQ